MTRRPPEGSDTLGERHRAAKDLARQLDGGRRRRIEGPALSLMDDLSSVASVMEGAEIAATPAPEPAETPAPPAGRKRRSSRVRVQTAASASDGWAARFKQSRET